MAVKGRHDCSSLLCSRQNTSNGRTSISGYVLGTIDLDQSEDPDSLGYFSGSPDRGGKSADNCISELGSSR